MDILPAKTEGRGASTRPRISNPRRRHRFLDHTAEVELRVEAESLAGLLVEATRALATLLLRQSRLPTAVGVPRQIEVRAHDRASLLVDWLNEVLYIAETDLWLPVELEIQECSEQRALGRAGGVPLEKAPATVKAVTLHGLHVEDSAGGLRAEVILDV